MTEVRCRRGCLPHPSGVTHQRHQARRPDSGPGRRAARCRRAGARRDQRSRYGERPAHRRLGPRHSRHARAGGGTGRLAGGGATFDLDEYVFEALRAGASGFLLKDTDLLELLDAVHVVARGDALLAPGVTRRLIAEFARRPEPTRAVPASLASLTEREREVLTLIARGLSNDEIAEARVVSPATAKTHVSRVMGKLDARDRAQLVVIAYESGLVEPGASR